MKARGATGAIRIYRLLLFLYPPGFRGRHGEDMGRVFQDSLRLLSARGHAGVALALATAALDACRTAPALWAEALARLSREGPTAGEDHLGTPLEGVAADLRYALRSLRRTPVHTTAALVTLALGIGANAALFSVADRVLLEPLPYAEPARLVAVFEARPSDGRDHEPPSPGNFLDWREKCAAFADMAAWQDGSGASTLRDEHEATVVETVKVTPTFFAVLGLPPSLGRAFDPGGERGAVFDVADRFRGGDRVLVMSHGLWKRRFGGDPEIVGRTVLMDGAPWEVLGVMPETLGLPRPSTDLFIPWDIVPSYAGFEGGPPRDIRFLNVIGRLREGVRVTEAQEALASLAVGLAEAHPKANAGWSVRVVSLRDELVASARPALWLLTGAVGFVLLLACANVASLQLARASGRRREMAVRLSLGASRSRLVRQLMTESAVLGLAGGLAGLAVARLALGILLTSPPESFGSLAGLGLNGRVLAFSAVLSLATAVLFGLLPALEASRQSAASALRDGGSGAMGGVRVRRARRVLIVGEVAAALLLLTGAGLLGRSFLRILSVDTGFDPRGLVTLRVTLDHATYETGAHSRAFYRALMQRLANLPGVKAAAGVTALPLSPVATDFARPYWREGEADPGGNAPKADIRMATPRYFDAMGMVVRRGRALNDDDRETSPRVVVVSETLARRAFPDEDAVGRRLILDYMGGAYPYEIVGIVNDVRFSSVKAAPRPELFIPHAQNPYLDLTVVVKGAGDGFELARRVERAIEGLDPRQPAHAVATMEELVRRSRSTDRFAAMLLAFLAVLAAVLTATGIHGLLAFLVEQRRQEMGLRQALGATRLQVVRLVLTESMRLVALGAALGLVLSLAFARQASSLLYEVGPTDPVAFGLALLAVTAVGALSSLLPARAAARLDPLAALRSE